MGFFSVVLAAIANFAFGAVWYMALAKPWMAASGVALDEDGQPANRSDPLPYITSFIAAVLVAGMMRHTFALGGIDSFVKEPFLALASACSLSHHGLQHFMDLAASRLH